MGIPKLHPTTPTALARANDRHRSFPLRDAKHRFEAPVLPGTTSGPSSTPAPIPAGWARYKHPAGGHYLYNHDMRLCTYLDATVRDICAELCDSARRLTELFLSQRSKMSTDDGSKWYIALGNAPSGEQGLGYYFASNDARAVSWVDSFEFDCLSAGCEHVDQSSSCTEAQYWKHCQLFPSTLAVSTELRAELAANLLHASADVAISKVTTSPYNAEDLERMTNIVKELPHEGSGTGRADLHSSWIVASFMHLHARGLWRSHYGQNYEYFHAYRVEDEQKPPTYQRPWAMVLFAPLTLRSAQVYAEELHAFRHQFSPARYDAFVTKVNSSIRDSNLLATVLLSTSVPFLDFSDNAAVTILTYCSLIMSAGSIIVGLAIFKQYRAKGADVPLKAVIILERIFRESHGIERLAIICSLPYVFLMWSLFLFLAALLIMCFDQTDTPTKVPTGVACAIVSLSIFWCLLTAGSPDKEETLSRRRAREQHERQVVENEKGAAATDTRRSSSLLERYRRSMGGSSTPVTEGEEA